MSCLSYLVIILLALVISTNMALELDFYRDSCPPTEKQVARVVSEAVQINPGLGAGLIRLHFHDCFIRGCDASILLDSEEGKEAEKDHFISGTLRGYEVIDEAKELLEEMCPNTVSCADILAFAARDAANLLGGIHYDLPVGRRDGLVSKGEDMFSLPAPFQNVSILEKQFADKGLSAEDLVILSGAHSLGRSQCASFVKRLEAADPSINPEFADGLKEICTVTNATTVPLDFSSPNKLDHVYYRNIKAHKVLFTSDQTLSDGKHTKKLVHKYAANRKSWMEGFGEAMVRMGSIEVLVGERGEIRKNCRLINKA